MWRQSETDLDEGGELTKWCQKSPGNKAIPARWGATAGILALAVNPKWKFRITPLARSTRWLLADERNSKWIKSAFLLTAVIYLIFIGVAELGPINYYGNDVLLQLDGGWRIFNGQIPYRDFYLGLGPLEYSITAAGMLLTHGGPRALALGNVAFGIAVGIWGWLLLRRRMAVIPALAAVAWLILTATSPSPLGSEYLSSAMIYNRHGWALLAIVLVECTFSSQRSRFLGGVSSGIALILMAFLKLSFFGVAFLLVLPTLPLKREEMRRCWGILTGIAVTVAAFSFYLRFAVSAFLVDMGLTIQARSGKLSYVAAIAEIPRSPVLVTVAIFSVIVALLVTGGKLCQRNGVTLILLGFIVVATAPLLRRCNFGEKGYQLTALWVITLLGSLVAAYPRAREKAVILTVIALGLGSIAADFFQNAENMVTLVQYQVPSVQSKGVTMAGQGMEHLRFYGSSGGELSGDNGRLYVADVNDGVALLTGWSSPKETVLTLGFHNPFPYLLRRKPAWGGGTWFLWGDNFPETHLLEASLMFGDAALIMVPHYPSSHQGSDEKIEQAYHAYLSQHFSFVASSQSWSLYRRKE